MRHLAFLPLLLAGCVAPPPPPPPVPLPTRPAPLPVRAAPVADWADGPAAPGNWTWRRDARGSVALFGVAGRDADFVVRCDLAERRISLTMPGTVPAGGGVLVVQTSDGARSLPAAAAGAAPPYAGAAVPAADGFLDRIAFSRGRFRVRLGGGPALVVPAWPELARTIEDCRG